MYRMRLITPKSTVLHTFHYNYTLTQEISTNGVKYFFSDFHSYNTIFSFAILLGYLSIAYLEIVTTNDTKVNV